MAEYDDALGRALRGFTGVEHVYSRVEPGKASVLVRFSSMQATESALSDPGRWRVTLGTTTSASLVHAELSAGSPIRSGAPLPIEAVVSLGGLPDLEEAARPPGSGCGTEVIARIAGGATPARPDVYADTSVPRLAPLGVPQVLINGRQDRIIPGSYAEKYQADMDKAGDHVRVRMIDRTGHVELIAPETAAWAAAVEEIERALGR
jgi:pimeloyl-ACP methyl ester carboxylesterase